MSDFHSRTAAKRLKNTDLQTTDRPTWYTANHESQVSLTIPLGLVNWLSFCLAGVMTWFIHPCLGGK